MKTVKFKHRNGVIFPRQVGDIVTGTYTDNGGFYIDYEDGAVGLVTNYHWDAEAANEHFENGIWIKTDGTEVIKFIIVDVDEDADVYTATIDGDSTVVSWEQGGATRSTTYRTDTVRSLLQDGTWLPIKPLAIDEVVEEPAPEPTHLEQARAIIAERELCVQLHGDHYQVDGFNSYRANNDVELLTICNLLKALSAYG